jgi:hypothetical protein
VAPSRDLVAAVLTDPRNELWTTTTLWAWGAAQTVWLPDVVTTVEELPEPLDPAVLDRRRDLSPRT